MKPVLTTPLFSGLEPIEWRLSGDKAYVIVDGHPYHVSFADNDSPRDRHGRFMALGLCNREFSGGTRKDVMKAAYWWACGYRDAGGNFPHEH